VTAADIIEYTLDSAPARDATATGYLERYIHGEIYRARSDVMAIVHCHCPDVIPFAATFVTAALMRGHGAVIAAASLHLVVGQDYYLNLNARLQLQAMQLGGSTVMCLDREEASKAANDYQRSWACPSCAGARRVLVNSQGHGSAGGHHRNHPRRHRMGSHSWLAPRRLRDHRAESRSSTAACILSRKEPT